MSSSPVDHLSQLSGRISRPSDRVLAALHEEMQREQERPGVLPARKVRSRAQRALLSAGLLAVGLVLTSIGAWSDNPSWLVLSAAAASLASGSLFLAGAIPGNMSRWSRGPRRALLTVVSVALFVALGAQADHFLPWAELVTDGGATTRLMACFSHALMTGVLCSALLMVIWRRTDPFSPGLTGSLLGLIGGVIGTVSVELTCPSAEGFHLTLGHGLAALLLAAIGFFSGRRWLTP